MNMYKKILRDQALRMKILNLTSFLPDVLKVRYQYLLKTHRLLHLKSPQRYTEKIQWYKLNYHTDLLTQCADKYRVRKYVESKGLAFLLNKLYISYDDADDIDFSKLPNQYAMKLNKGSGTNYFVKDNKIENPVELRTLAKKWLSYGTYSLSAEWCYQNIKPCIIFEKLLPRDSNNDLPDYKFFCFNGEPYCLYTMIDYTENHSDGKLGFYDMDFNQLPYRRLDFAPITQTLSKPKNFDKMVEYARILSSDFPHVRVDFYNIDGKIIFGELTFYNASGYTVFEPDEFDFILGKQFSLPESEKEKKH